MLVAVLMTWLIVRARGIRPKDWSEPILIVFTVHVLDCESPQDYIRIWPKDSKRAGAGLGW